MRFCVRFRSRSCCQVSAAGGVQLRQALVDAQQLGLQLVEAAAEGHAIGQLGLGFLHAALQVGPAQGGWSCSATSSAPKNT